MYEDLILSSASLIAMTTKVIIAISHALREPPRQVAVNGPNVAVSWYLCPDLTEQDIKSRQADVLLIVVPDPASAEIKVEVKHMYANVTKELVDRELAKLGVNET